MAATRAAMEDAGRRFAAAKVDTLILLDPETVHTLQGIALEGSCTFFAGEATLSIGMSAHAGGAAGSIRERYACDVPLAQAILKAGRDAGFPAVSPPVRMTTCGSMVGPWFRSGSLFIGCLYRVPDSS